MAFGTLTNKYLDQIPENTRLGRNELAWLKEKALTEERLNTIRELNKFAQNEFGVPLSKLAIAWTIKNPNVFYSNPRSVKNESFN